MKKLLIIALLLIGMGAKAQSLADKELERIVSGELAEEISLCPADSSRYMGAVVVVELAKNSQGIAQDVPSGLRIMYIAMIPHADLGYATLSGVVKHVIDKLACNRLSKPSCLSSTDSQSIKHRDGWVHPAAR